MKFDQTHNRVRNLKFMAILIGLVEVHVRFLLCHITKSNDKAAKINDPCNKSEKYIALASKELSPSFLSGRNELLKE